MKIFKKNLHPLKLIAVAAIVSAFFISCKKETKPATIQPVETAPIFAALSSNSYQAYTRVRTIGNYSYELGTIFSVAKNGKILRLGTKMPYPGTFRVALWDSSAPNAPLAQATVTQTASATLTFSSISPVSVSAAKTYMVSLWVSDTTDYFYFSNVSFPMNSGNITLKGSALAIRTSANPPTYPSSQIGEVDGLADIEFKAD
jgi:Domain of unknown function (DUF4082)